MLCESADIVVSRTTNANLVGVVFGERSVRPRLTELLQGPGGTRVCGDGFQRRGFAQKLLNPLSDSSEGWAVGCGRVGQRLMCDGSGLACEQRGELNQHGCTGLGEFAIGGGDPVAVASLPAADAHTEAAAIG